MSLPPKSSGDILYATLWNIVQALAESAMRPTDNLSGLADNATARTNLGLETVAATGDYDDLSNRPIEYQTDGPLRIVDEHGFVLAEFATGGITLGLLLDLLDGPGVSFRETASADGLRIVDEHGFVVADFADGAVTLPGVTLTAAGAVIPTATITDATVAGTLDVAGITLTENDGAVALKLLDEYGFVGGSVDINGVGAGVFGGGGSSTPEATTYSQSEIDARDGINRGAAASMVINLDVESYRPIRAYNHVMLYGQSLAAGAEGVPSLSLTAMHDNLMLGNSVHSASGNTGSVVTWTAVTSDAFYPLTEAAYGETILTAACNYWRTLTFQWRGITANASQRLVASECAVGGKYIAELSKGASPEHYARLTDCATLAASVAGASTYGIAALIWMQGENDRIATSYADYLAAMRTLYADFTADVAVAIAGQTEPPAMFMYQTTGSTISDTLAMNVPQAQLDMAITDDGVYMVGPVYPYPDSNNLHLPTNSYRWFGAMVGKVMHRVLDRGHRWKPLHPIRATRRGAQVLVDFHVPYPPLAAEPYYRSSSTGGANTAYTLSDWGFSVVVSGSSLTISTVEFASATQVLITMASPLPDGYDVYVRYADGAHNGSGNIRDSDPALAIDSYIYDIVTYPTQGTVDDIPALDGARYPLWNWCAAFNMLTEIE